MPVVNIQWLKGRNRAVKEKLAAEIEKLMVNEAGCQPGDTYIFFNETERENFAESGKLYE
ncbi:MAG: tautomerase family protein [Candidatus Margulisbacteria bacterium]|jgi:phenylpyruvate tautomerase PptA (4-oxalocrotonate tautomerase family)|nr:tautomerase family protein [Candidatus Margulisiibacteriota bacterium]